MADSDDEYDRKRRDKFRGERSDSFRTERRDRPLGGSSARDEWSDRNPFRGGAGSATAGSGRHRPDYSDYRGPNPRPRYGSPSREMPPAKRMRPDWGEGDMRPAPRFGGYDPYLMQAWNDHYQSLHSVYSHAAHAPPSREPPVVANDTLTQPPMLTLKQFLDTQDESISDSEVMRKYTEYKTDFKRQQLNEFFVAHKDEEWFKNKYHPEDSLRRSAEQRGFLKKRTEVFAELLANGTIENVKVDSSQSEALIRLLDTCVIKLEGGTDEDLKALDEKPKEFIFERKVEIVEATSKTTTNPTIDTNEEKKPIVLDDDKPVAVSPDRQPLRKLSTDENWEDDDDNDNDTENTATVEKKTNEDEADKEQQSKQESPKSGGAASGGSGETRKKLKKKKTKKRKRNSSDDDDDSTSSSSHSDSSSSSDEDEEKIKSIYDVEDGLRKEQKEEAERDKEAERKIKESVESVNLQPAEDEDKEVKQNTNEGAEVDANSNESDATTDAAAVVKKEEDVDEPMAIDEKPENGIDKKDEQENSEKNAAKTKPSSSDAVVEEITETIDLDKVKDGPQPRALHRTSSIFLRNLAPAVTKAEIEAICNRFSGYLRVAIADPLVERRWYRRGWITFTRDVNIKEICWSLNNQRLRDCEMGAIVNRDLSRRVRPANGITAHKQIVRADIKLCAKVAMNLDERFRLWIDDDVDAESVEPIDTKESPKNGTSTTAATGAGYGIKSKNPALQNITDYLIEEASAEEDELLGLAGDNKDGEGEPIERDELLLSVLDRLVLYLRIVHSVDYYNHCEYPYEDEMPNRCGIIHARGPAPMRVPTNDIQEYIKMYEGKLQQFLTKTDLLSDEGIKELGAKNAETEVEKFVQANTQELAKDKWLCPLSGKKFKGPEFIRKHIFNKHEEKVDEVRKEVEFFNNYLRDPKRPQLPEHPGSVKRPDSEPNRSGGGYRAPMYPPFSGMPYGFGPPMMGGGGGGRGGGRGFAPVRRPGGFDYRPRSHYRDLDAPQEPY